MRALAPIVVLRERLYRGGKVIAGDRQRVV